MASARPLTSGPRRRSDEQDGVSLLLSKSVVCVVAAWALAEQTAAIRLGLLAAAAFFAVLALLGRRRQFTDPPSTQPRPDRGARGSSTMGYSALTRRALPKASKIAFSLLRIPR